MAPHIDVSFSKLVLRFGQGAGGSVSVLFAALAVVLLGAAGLAIDFGRSESAKSAMQVSLDSAVLAGAVAEPGEEIATAERHFAVQMENAGLSGFAASFALAPSGEVTGRAGANLTASLAQLLGFRTVALEVVSSATRNKTNRVCALVLDPAAPQALLVNNGADIDAPDCEFHVRSTANPAAVFNAGTSLTTARLCIAGASVLDNGGNHPGMQTSCAAAPDPYAGALPEPSSASCDYFASNHNGGTVNLTPGVYCGGINFNAAPDVTFAPGLYVISGGNWNVNGGTWTGNGVVFYFADSSIIQFNNGVDAALSAPASGAYEGVAMFEKGGLARSPFVLDDSQGFDIEGLIYLPSRDTIFNASSSLANKKMTLVVNTLILNQTTWLLESGNGGFASSGTPGTSRLTQ